MYKKVRQDERGRDAEIVDSKLEFRKIKIKTLTENKNMAQIAADIVDKCKYIHPSRVEEIEQLLVIRLINYCYDFEDLDMIYNLLCPRLSSESIV